MAGLFSSAGLFGTNSTPAQIVTTNPYDQMVQGGQSGNFNSLAQGNSTYLADMFSQLGTGQAPSYYQSYQNQAMPYQMGQLNQQFYGTPGNRANSVAGMSMSNAAQFGLNPKATNAMQNKNYLQYQNQQQSIDNYFSGLGLNTIQQTANNLPGWATGQQNSLTEAFRPTTNMIPAQSGSLGLFGNMVASQASALNNMIGFNGLNNMMGGGSGGGGSSSGMSGFSNTAPYMMPSASTLQGPMSLAAMGG